MMRHQLTPLPYEYNALQPWIDEQTMRVHHAKHHQKYVDNLNAAEEKLAVARANGDFGLIRYFERLVAFNGSGHFLHSIFWTIMGPDQGGEPHDELAEQIVRDFGSFANFKAQFSAAAVGVEASGWGILGWQPQGKQLVILAAEDHQNQTQWGVTPILVLDVWEHAYYLKYQNRRTEYVHNWWNVVNWRKVADFFIAARVA
jgi:superoxide dismutase, Fe-Mn family